MLIAILFSCWLEGDIDAFLEEGERAVTFNKNNSDAGSTEANPQSRTVRHPATTAVLPAPPVRPGYIFNGWNTRESGSGTAFTSTTTVTANITVFAQWIPVIEMVQVAGGSFALGRERGTAGDGNVVPVSTVTLNEFYMGKYQVTQEQWQAVMRGNANGISLNPSYFHGGIGREPASGEVQSRRPVERVSWYEALVFCNRLSVIEGLNPAYRINDSTNPDNWGLVPTNSNSTWNAVTILNSTTGYRLPTEAQWEYAAKGGTQGAYTYSGSNDPNAVAWYTSNSGSRTHEVGLKQANSFGLHDMTGNVWEWCWDWWGNYTSTAKTDPVGASSGSYRVNRGGAWGNSALFLPSVYRRSRGMSIRGNSVGFRVVRPQ